VAVIWTPEDLARPRAIRLQQNVTYIYFPLPDSHSHPLRPACTASGAVRSTAAGGVGLCRRGCAACWEPGSVQEMAFAVTLTPLRATAVLAGWRRRPGATPPRFAIVLATSTGTGVGGERSPPTFRHLREELLQLHAEADLTQSKGNISTLEFLMLCSWDQSMLLFHRPDFLAPLISSSVKYQCY
jgi:hypothetical protein